MNKTIGWQGLALVQLACKALYIPAYQTLVISDWHLGKLGHFRREGLFVPAMKMQEELERLGELIRLMTVRRVVFLGDLFHASYNKEWDELLTYLRSYPEIEFILTKGNHDVRVNIHLAKSSINVLDLLELGDYMVLSHEPLSNLPATVLNIVGHVHPGVTLKGKGRQQFRLPCFMLQGNELTLPAFGRWTGLYIIKKNKDNRVFPVFGDEVIELL